MLGKETSLFSILFHHSIPCDGMLSKVMKKERLRCVCTMGRDPAWQNVELKAAENMGMWVGSSIIWKGTLRSFS